MATDMPLTKEDDEGGVFYRQISGDDNERPEVTEALLESPRAKTCALLSIVTS